MEEKKQKEIQNGLLWKPTQRQKRSIRTNTNTLKWHTEEEDSENSKGETTKKDSPTPVVDAGNSSKNTLGKIMMEMEK